MTLDLKVTTKIHRGANASTSKSRKIVVFETPVLTVKPTLDKIVYDNNRILDSLWNSLCQ